MFRKSSASTQMDMFSSPENVSGKESNEVVLRSQGMAQYIFNQITSKIDESIFSVLYKMGTWEFQRHR